MRHRLLWSALGLTILTAGCGESQTPGDDRADVANGDVPVGQSVTLEGIVNEAYGDQAFAMAGDGVLGRFGDGAEVLVVGTDLPVLAAGTDVRVTGTVRKYKPARVSENASGPPVNLPDADAYDRAIVAREVQVIDPSGTITD